jgi:hypothetical protein
MNGASVCDAFVIPSLRRQSTLLSRDMALGKDINRLRFARVALFWAAMLRASVIRADPLRALFGEANEA